MAFQLVQGINVDNIGNVHSAYFADNNGICAVLSADVVGDIVSELTEKLCGPVFFFLEIPCSSEEEKQLRKNKNDPYHYKIYYLDNCTIPVAKAIMERYGELLINDGVSRFGFGSHESEEEIYCKDYQTVSVYGNTDRFKSVFDEMNIPAQAEIKTLWDVLSDDNIGTCSTVEINGETVNDIAENLKDEGMYLADIIEEK